MLEAAIALGAGMVLARVVLTPLQVYLARRQERFDEARARAVVAEITRRSRDSTDGTRAG